MWIEKLPSQRYRGGFRTPAGKKFSRTFDFRYEAEAWAEAAEAAAAAATTQGRRDGQLAGPSALPTASVNLVTGAPRDDLHDQASAAARRSPTVNAYAAAYLERRRGGLAKNTVEWYSSQIRGVRSLTVGSAPMHVLRRGDLEATVTELVDAGVNPPTIEARFKLLSILFCDALTAGVVDRNPCIGVLLPTKLPKPEVILSREDEAALLLAADAQLSLMCLTALDAGLRWQEAGALTVGQVRDHGRYLHIRQVLEKDGTRRDDTKPHKARTVPTTKRLRRALLAAIAEAQSAVGVDDQVALHDLPLFSPRDGGRLDYYNWRHRAWRPTVRRAKLRPAPTFHDLRHTYASRLAAAGVPRVEIQQLLGHADERTTARYIHAGSDGRRAKLVRDALAV